MALARIASAAPVLLLAALLSGCVESGLEGTDGAVAEGAAPDSIPAGEPAQGQDAGTSASHAQAQRTESDVTVSREGNGRYVARKTVTLANDFGGASQASYTLKTVNGGVSANAWDDGGYRTVATLAAHADSEQAARDNLARLKVTHTDQLAGARLTLSTVISFPPNVQGLSGSLQSSLPEEPSYLLNLESTNGGLAIGGLGGSSASARTTNGGVDLRASFNSITVDTSNGGVDLDGTFNRGDVSTTNGGVSGNVRSSSSGSWEVETTNGEVDLRFDGGAYDVEGSCTNGSVTLSVPGGEAVGAQSRTHKHVRSPGYADAKVQVAVDLSTTNGNVGFSA